MSDINKTDGVIAKAMDARKNGQVDNEIHLSTGVVLLAKQANPNVLIRIMTNVERPKPPVYHDEMMGRMMENPDHPDYKKQVEAWEMNYNNGVLNVLVGEGTTLKSVPKGMEGPHPKDKKPLQWVRDYRSYGLPIIEDSESWRYITWVMFRAAVTDKDTQLIAEKVKSLSGVKEADVQSAETFPDGDDTARVD